MPLCCFFSEADEMLKSACHYAVFSQRLMRCGNLHDIVLVKSEADETRKSTCHCVS